MDRAARPKDAETDGAGWGWLQRDCVAHHARVRPEALACAVLLDGSRHGYGELDRRIAARTGDIGRAVSERGARVAILARNCLEHVLLFYATARAGAVFVPLNWRLPAPELSGLLIDSGAEIVLADAEFEACAREAAAGLDTPPLVLPLGEAWPVRRDALAWEALGPDEPSLLLYTSGTTGRPKGAIVTRRSGFFAAFNFGQVGSVIPGCTTLADAPMFHTVGLFAIMHAGLTAGASVLISDRFVPAVTLERLSDPALNVTHYFGVPQMARALAEDPAFAAADLSRLQGFFVGGAPLPDGLALNLMEKGVPVSNGYGSTEGGTLMHVPLDPKIRQEKLGSAGVPAPAVEIRLVGADGEDVAQGEIGEIWLRGPAVTPGYWRQPEATAAAFHEDWFRTGDAGRQDADGFYFIVDRWKDMYITGGENVYPAEVEAALLQLKGVAEAAVVGVPDDRWGEAGAAYIVLTPGAALAAAEVEAYCRQRLAGYKRPAHVHFVEALPRNAAGKVRKQVLRAAHADASTTRSI